MPIVQALYDCYKIIHGIIVKFPKIERYALGIEIEKATLLLLRLTLEAGNEPLPVERVSHLARASAELDLLKLLIRLSYDIEAIKQKEYILLQERLYEIGKMLGGWLRATRKN